MTTNTCCANCGATIHNPRHTIIKKGRRLTLCLNCLRSHIPTPRTTVRTEAAPAIEISDITLAQSLEDDDFDDERGFYLGVGQA